MAVVPEALSIESPAPAGVPRVALLYAGWFAMWTLLGLVLFGKEMTLDHRTSPTVDWHPELLCWLTQAYVWGLLSIAVRWLSRRLPIAGPNLWRSLACHLPLSVLLALTTIALVDIVGLSLGIPWYLPDFWSVYSEALPVRLPLDTFTYWLLLGFWEVSRGHENFQQQKQIALQSQLQLSILKTQLATAQLTALKNQLQPHFLFNTLNSIMALVRRQQSAPAELMLEKLADLLRCVLRVSAEQELSLGEELEFVRLYLSIEQVRFQDRLQYEIAVEPDLLRVQVPAMCLQPLVENSIHHGISRTSGPGKVVITAARSGDSLRIEVRDNGCARATADNTHGSGIGLSNTRARLHNLYGEQGRLTLQNSTSGGALATLQIPIRTTTGAALPAAG